MLEISAIGYLGKDPEIRSTQGGQTYTSFSMACTKRWTDKAGEKQEKTMWLRVTAWDRNAETMATLARQGALKTGSLMLVRGEPSIRPYTDNNGNDRVSLDVKVEFFQLLNGGGNKNDTNPNFNSSFDDNSNFELPVRQPQQESTSQPILDIPF